jgi:hypothetical protein
LEPRRGGGVIARGAAPGPRARRVKSSPERAWQRGVAPSRALSGLESPLPLRRSRACGPGYHPAAPSGLKRRRTDLHDPRRTPDSPSADLPRGGSRPRVAQQTPPAVLVPSAGATTVVAPGPQRLSSSKGQTLGDRGAQRDSSGRDYLTRGLLYRKGGPRRSARPSSSAPTGTTPRPARTGPGTGHAGYVRGRPASSSGRQFTLTRPGGFTGRILPCPAASAAPSPPWPGPRSSRSSSRLRCRAAPRRDRRAASPRHPQQGDLNPALDPLVVGLPTR